MSRSEAETGRDAGEWGFAIETGSGLVEAFRRSLLDGGGRVARARALGRRRGATGSSGARVGGRWCLTDEASVAVYRACQVAGRPGGVGRRRRGGGPGGAGARGEPARGRAGRQVDRPAAADRRDLPPRRGRRSPPTGSTTADGGCVMRIAEVIGRVTLSRQHPSLKGGRFLIALPMPLEALLDDSPKRGEEVDRLRRPRRRARRPDRPERGPRGRQPVRQGQDADRRLLRLPARSDLSV